MQIARAVAAFAIAMFVAAPAIAQDKGAAKAKESASTVKVLLENDKVRVTEATFKPGDVSRADRKARVNYFVTSGTLERTSKDGKKTVVERKAGTALYLEADSDVVRNIGKTTFVVISTVYK